MNCVNSLVMFIHSYMPYRTCHTSDPDVLTQLLNHCSDTAKGMCYLSEKGFVHRDLAARNILVTGGKICKVSSYKYRYKSQACALLVYLTQ